MIPKSAVSNVLWPAVPNERGSLMLALQYQLEESQWLPRDEIESRQMGALARLLRHAVRTVPYYRSNPVFAEASKQGGLTPERWREQPILSRAALQDAGNSMRSDFVPSDHGPVGQIQTTGSTGRPVRAQTTRITSIMWSAITLRDALWRRRVFSGKFVAIRADLTERIPPEGLNLNSWGPSASTFETGPCAVLGISHDVKFQAEWLAGHDPDYLLSYPSNLVALADHFQANGMRLPKLREVSTYGETLTPDLRAACKEAWGVPVVDMYSSQEIGYMALQCPDTELYHVQAESCYVEILDDDGRPCGPGELGRVVVTPMHNYATPFLRYELGDYAEVGAPCVCGRGLPVLHRIAGRQRNMWTLPDGQRVWPMFSSKLWGHIDAVRQLQLVQHSLDHVEAKIVGPRPMSDEEEARFTALLRKQFPFPFELTLSYKSEIDRSEGMKFEDFVSFVPRQPQPA